MEYLSGALTVALITIFGAMSPGPDFAIVVRNNLVRSRAAGVATAFGIALGNLFYVVLALVGLGAVIANSVVVFSLIKYLGALYLVYLGIKFLLSKEQKFTDVERIGTEKKSLLFSVRDGFLTNFANPKFIIFLLAVFTQVINPSTPLVVQALYGIQIPIIAFMWFSLLSLFLTTSAIRIRISNYLHRVEQVMGGLLIGLGIKIAFDAK